MKVAVLAGLVLLFGILVSGCAVRGGQEPLPTVNAIDLNVKIADLESNLQKELTDQIQKDANNQNRINALSAQLAIYKAAVDRQTALDNSNWVYPGKVEYTNYTANTLCTYTIRVHNGSQLSKSYSIITDQVYDPDPTIARAPRELLTSWVTYDGNTTGEYVLKPQETRDILVSFREPIDGRFISITDKGIDVDNSTLDPVQWEILSRFKQKITIRIDDLNEVPRGHLDSMIANGWLVRDNTFKFLASYGESVPAGTVIARNAVLFVIHMNQYSESVP